MCVVEFRGAAGLIMDSRGNYKMRVDKGCLGSNG